MQICPANIIYKFTLGNTRLVNWIIFLALSLVWGSSFILIKVGLNGLSAVHVASLRVLSAGIVLLPVVLKNFAVLPVNKLGLIFLSGILGSLLPAYLFCIAETGLDGSTAGVLNALTPIFAVIIGAIFFRNRVPAIKIMGMLIAFAGSVLLYASHSNILPGDNFVNVLLVVLATICYGINVNLVRKSLKDVPSLIIAALALVSCSFIALLVLIFTGYFSLNFGESAVRWATFYASVLGIFGTAIASVFFYMLIKRAGVVFSSMVTYGIPVIALGWGIYFGEKVGWIEAGCMLLILLGVYLANSNKPVSDKR